MDPKINLPNLACYVLGLDLLLLLALTWPKEIKAESYRHAIFGVFFIFIFFENIFYRNIFSILQLTVLYPYRHQGAAGGLPPGSGAAGIYM